MPEGKDNSGNSKRGYDSQSWTQKSLDKRAWDSLSEQEWTQVIFDKKKKSKELQKEIAKRKILKDGNPRIAPVLR